MREEFWRELVDLVVDGGWWIVQDHPLSTTHQFEATLRYPLLTPSSYTPARVL